MNQLVAIAMSGGVDSTMAAYLLKKRGHQVTGIHFITGYDTVSENITSFNGVDDVSAAKKAALQKLLPITKRLDIPIEVIDIRSEFERRVVQYFIRTYQAGQTPNPCIVCNPSIKFGTVFETAKNLGATTFATGHYARIVQYKQDKSDRFHLLRGIDTSKEQSYFLARLTQEQLSRAWFPLGGMTKFQVKKMAKEQGLFSLVKKESQDVCFIKQNTYADFLMKKNGMRAKPGPIADMRGRVIGEHRGLHLFTIGQRRGINCPAEKPYYVLRIDVEKNRLVVGDKQDLLSSECNVTDVNWICKTPNEPISAETKMRYRHKAAPSTLIPVDTRTVRVVFKTPQSAITPGQCAVFYRREEVLGGGWIQI
jgi:tRNA-specific 2-thiouridylase